MEKGTQKLSIPVSFETKPPEETPLAAFLFTRDGKLVGKSLVEKEIVEIAIHRQ
ncbi:MAG: hypothetical protein ABJA37_01800 [Ferruginibacter sp.]